MAARNRTLAIGKSGTNQSMILSADLEREMQQFIKANAQPKWTPQMDAVLMKLYGPVQSPKVAQFINSKFGTSFSAKQIQSRYHGIKP